MKTAASTGARGRGERARRDEEPAREQSRNGCERNLNEEYPSGEPQEQGICRARETRTVLVQRTPRQARKISGLRTTERKK